MTSVQPHMRWTHVPTLKKNRRPSIQTLVVPVHESARFCQNKYCQTLRKGNPELSYRPTPLFEHTDPEISIVPGGNWWRL